MTKQVILDYLDNVLHPIVSPDNWNVYSELHDMIEELPSAEPVKRGKWLWVDGVRCSECNYKLETTGLPSYCPNCGRRVDEE